MALETDGIEEAFEGQLRVLVTAAGQVGERVARAREESMRKAQAQSEQHARELHSRLEAERRVARAEFSNAHRSGWWDRVTPEQIAHTYQLATAWGHEDPDAVRAERRIRDELQTRYDIDVNDTGADPQAVKAAVERAERLQADGLAERRAAAAEEAEAVRLLTEADRTERAADEQRAVAEHAPTNEEVIAANSRADLHDREAQDVRDQAAPLYDSVERRKATAREMETKGIDQRVVASRMQADVSQAKPATAAVTTQASRAKRARAARGKSAQRQRGGLQR